MGRWRWGREGWKEGGGGEEVGIGGQGAARGS